MLNISDEERQKIITEKMQKIINNRIQNMYENNKPTIKKQVSK